MGLLRYLRGKSEYKPGEHIPLRNPLFRWSWWNWIARFSRDLSFFNTHLGNRIDVVSESITGLKEELKSIKDDAWEETETIHKCLNSLCDRVRVLEASSKKRTRRRWRV